jgi:hypothetical protein
MFLKVSVSMLPSSLPAFRAVGAAFWAEATTTAVPLPYAAFQAG